MTTISTATPAAPAPPPALRNFSLYRDDGPDHDWLRAQHLAAVLRLTPAMMAANVVNALVVALALDRWREPHLLAWLGMLALVVGFGLHGWWKRRKQAPTRASRRAMHRSTWHAGMLGALWALVPALWFRGASHDLQLVIAIVITGMMAAGAFALSRLPAASLAYTGCLSLGSLVALWSRGGAAAATVTGLLVVYAGICVIAAMAIGRQATALLLAKRDAQRQQQLLSVLLHDLEEHAAEGLWETDASGCLCYVSPRMGELFGTDPAALQGQPLLALLAPRSPRHLTAVRHALTRGLPFRNLTIEVTASGGGRWWTLSAKPNIEGVGQSDGWRGVVVDVTEEVQAQDRMRHLAHYDSLTGLANRLTLRNELAQSIESGGQDALMAIDIDRFKAINDTHGHSTGDGLLKAVGLRLRECVRPQDLVARLGGDEFAVLIRSGCSADGLKAAASRLDAAFARPCEVGHLRLPVTVSAGIALAPEAGDRIDDWIGNADLALYRAKADGSARTVVYDNRLGEQGRRDSAIEEALRSAVEEGQLALHRQPKLAVKGSAVIGFEALLRWRHPTLGAVSPAEFIPIAERTGRIHALGEWALREACRLAAGRLPGLNVAVNVSPAQLRAPEFEQQVRRAMAEAGLPPERLELEITESLFIEDPEDAVRRLSALLALGVRIALDDFGAGYSSLGYLRQFRFDLLKIDRQFVDEMMTREDAQAIVGTIVSLAHTLGMRTVAEGVETEDQRRTLVALGCDELQGYLIARPVPVEDWPQAMARIEAALTPA